jgi:hypothetical protein
MEIKNGDFASYLEQAALPRKPTQDVALAQTAQPQGSEEPKAFDGEAFAEMLIDDEKLEAYAAKMRADAQEQAELEPMSDEEFERQALEAGGSDGDASTPE